MVYGSILQRQYRSLHTQAESPGSLSMGSARARRRVVWHRSICDWAQTLAGVLVLLRHLATEGRDHVHRVLGPLSFTLVATCVFIRTAGGNVCCEIFGPPVTCFTPNTETDCVVARGIYYFDRYCGPSGLCYMKTSLPGLTQWG